MLCDTTANITVLHEMRNSSYKKTDLNPALRKQNYAG